MAAPARSRAGLRRSPADVVLDSSEDATVLEVLDDLLNKGVAVNGDVVLGIAGVDLIYLRLSTLLCAVDRLMAPPVAAGRAARRPARRPASRRSRKS